MATTPKEGTKQVNWMVPVDALNLLDKLGLGPRQRGQYVADLIRKAARQEESKLAIQEKIAMLERELAELRALVKA